MDTISIEYLFRFSPAEQISFLALINKHNRTIVSTNPAPLRDVAWTNLSYGACSNCPLQIRAGDKCPVAIHLQALVETFKDHLSYEKVDIEVRDSRRSYHKRTCIQYGLQSLFGVLMAASGCPRLSFLSPMAIYHLPFSDMEETMVRTLSFYLLRRFHQGLLQGQSDCSLEALKQEYQSVFSVNQGIIERIRTVNTQGDAPQNALVILNAFAQVMVLQPERIEEVLTGLFQGLQEVSA